MLNYPATKLTIIGGGIIGLMEAYFTFRKAKSKGEPIRITILEKNQIFAETTASKIAPSLTPDEILSVVPRGSELIKRLRELFSVPGGIRVDDVRVDGVDAVNDSAIAREFIEAVEAYSQDEAGHRDRTARLLELGRTSMQLWQQIYDEADAELREILIASNFNPCREPTNPDSVLHDGYRIDLIRGIPNAADKAQGMIADYQGLGYNHCQLLSPAEVQQRDPSLADFCRNNSIEASPGIYAWKNDVVALWRPGGCLDAETFLPKFAAYLSKVMGKYVNADGKTKDNFRFKFNRQVTHVDYDTQDQVNGLMLSGGYTGMKRNKHPYRKSEYVFCPGESVGTLRKLGFEEPAYAIFAGASLKLTIPIPDEATLQKYKDFNHCMEVHEAGVVLAWQGRTKDRSISIAVAGTKAFYADQPPRADQDFARNRTLLQLNIVNAVCPELISIALGRNTPDQTLTEADMHILEARNIAKRAVGSRAVAFDGVPTFGRLYRRDDGQLVSNVRATTGLSSGGIAFAPAAVAASQSAMEEQPDPILGYTDSRRKPRSR